MVRSTRYIYFDYKQGSNQVISDCPDVGKPGDPCWKVCRGSIMRQDSTIGYENVALRYSIDPWAAALPDKYCEISWSNDNATWNIIDRQYDSQDEIIENRALLGEDSWDKESIFIRIVSEGISCCCYMADFALLGGLMSDEQSNTDSISDHDTTTIVRFSHSESGPDLDFNFSVCTYGVNEPEDTQYIQTDNIEQTNGKVKFLPCDEETNINEYDRNNFDILSFLSNYSIQK